MIQDRVFEATKEKTPGFFALMERGFYRHFIKVHLNILYNNNPEYDVHDILGKEITRNIVLPVMLESGLINLSKEGIYSTEYTRINIEESPDAKLLFFRSLETILIEISKKAHREDSEKFAKSSAYINKRADREFIQDNINKMHECINNINNAPISENPENEVEIELIYASIRER